jgi:hypothetical protein
MSNEIHAHILDAERLRQLSGKRTASGVRRWARAQGIRYKESERGPWTTLEAVNASLGLGAVENRPYRPEEVL